MKDAITGGAVVAGIIAVLYALRPYLIHNKGHESNGRAGFKDASFWEKRFERLETAIATVDQVMREHRQLSHGEAQDIRDLLVEIDTSLKVNIAVGAEKKQR